MVNNVTVHYKKCRTISTRYRPSQQTTKTQLHGTLLTAPHAATRAKYITSCLALFAMKFGSYAWVVNRSGGLISLLAGQKDYVRQQQSIMLSCGSNSVRLWSSTPWASSRQAVIPAWRCVAQQDGDDICTHDSPVGLKLDDVPEASFSVSVKSPQQMEETGAFFGKDSQEGDIALLWG